MSRLVTGTPPPERHNSATGARSRRSPGGQVRSQDTEQSARPPALSATTSRTCPPLSTRPAAEATVTDRNAGDLPASPDP